MKQILPVILVGLAAGVMIASDHASVAKKHETRAVELELKAQKHDAEADRLAKAAEKSPLANKWPAMAQGPTNHERAKALQARRAAAEARELVAKELRLAEKAAQKEVE